MSEEGYNEARMMEFRGTASTIIIGGICDYCEKNEAREIYHDGLDSLLLCTKCYDRMLELHGEE